MTGADTGWIGVVGSRESLDRFRGAGPHWWCLPNEAKAGSIVAMYCTGQTSKSHQGVFAVFRVEAFDATRNSECKGYGRASGYGSTAFAHINLVKRLDVPVSSKALRSDPILGVA